MRFKLSTAERRYILYLNYIAIPVMILLFVFLFVLNNSLPDIILWPLLTILIIILLLGVYEYFEQTLH